MRKKIIELLKEKNDYVSGEEISKIFGITRASIWKHIQTLKEEGYNIEGISRRGYKLISSPDLLFEDDIKKCLKTQFIGHNIKHYFSVSSTNDTAKAIANDGFVDGTLVISEEQTGGKGRLGRIWSSPKGGIWMSILLKPNIEPIYASKLTQLAAAALIKVLRSLEIDAFIKWPNDIYINGKKVCGILTEMKCDMDRINYIVVGVGINVNLDKSDFNEDVLSSATSLKIEKNRTFSRIDLLTEFLKSFEELYIDFVEKGDYSKVVSICRDFSILLNKDAFLITSRSKEAVTCVGINDEGELIVKDSNGNEKRILSGEITFRAN